MNFLDYNFTNNYILNRLTNHYKQVWRIETGQEGNTLYLCEGRLHSIGQFFEFPPEKEYFYWKHDRTRGWFEGGKLFGIFGAKGVCKTINADLVRSFIVAKRANVIFTAYEELLCTDFVSFMDNSLHNHVQESNKEEVYVILNKRLKRFDEFLSTLS